MKILMWILIVGIPLTLLLHIAGVVMSIQHWPFGRQLSTVAALMTLLLLIIAWIFAYGSRKQPEGIRFDSF